MPGVPSGKGCDACRKQKKKCDQAKPQCSRCARLNISCVGSGQQRYVFKTQEIGSNRCSSVSSRDSSRHKSPSPAIVVSSSTNALVAALVAVIQPTTNVRWNIAWTYGDFLLGLPKRLGVNEALDSAVESLLSAHADMCVDRTRVSSKTLALYGHAVTSLRSSLDDPATAAATETLCAVYLIIIQQAFIGSGSKYAPISHGEGALQIIKARRHLKANSDFEKRILLTIRGPIIFEAVFNPKIRCEEWDDLILNEFNDPESTSQLIRYIGEVPAFQERGRNLKLCGVADNSLLGELYDRLLVLRLTLDKARIALGDFEKTEYEPGLLHLTYQRIYGLAMMPVLIYNCMLQALSATSSDLQLEAAALIQETIILAQRSHIYRPLGASYVCLCLVLAFAASINPQDRQATEDLLRDYAGDFPGVHHVCRTAVLDRTSRYLQLESVELLKEMCIA